METHTVKHDLQVICPTCNGNTYTGRIGVDEQRCTACDGRGTVSKGFVETGIVTFQGKDFSAGGAMVTDERIIVYPAEPTEGHGTAHMTRGYVFNWGNIKLGSYRVTGYASGFRNITGRRTKLTCYRVTLHDGRQYVGRGLGAGCVLRARRAKVTR